jgi:hypothetical protein
MPHNHPLYKVDNGLTFNMIEGTVRGHDVAATIAPFRRTWDGRRALLALQSQHAGKAINDQLVKDAENILKNRTWSGATSVTLIQHMGLHWKAYITLTPNVLSTSLLNSLMIGHESCTYWTHSK